MENIADFDQSRTPIGFHIQGKNTKFFGTVDDFGYLGNQVVLPEAVLDNCPFGRGKGIQIPDDGLFHTFFVQKGDVFFQTGQGEQTAGFQIFEFSAVEQFHIYQSDVFAGKPRHIMINIQTSHQSNLSSSLVLRIWSDIVWI